MGGRRRDLGASLPIFTTDGRADRLSAAGVHHIADADVDRLPATTAETRSDRAGHAADLLADR